MKQTLSIHVCLVLLSVSLYQKCSSLGIERVWETCQCEAIRHNLWVTGIPFPLSNLLRFYNQKPTCSENVYLTRLVSDFSKTKFVSAVKTPHTVLITPTGIPSISATTFLPGTTFKDLEPCLAPSRLRCHIISVLPRFCSADTIDHDIIIKCRPVSATVK